MMLKGGKAEILKIIGDGMKRRRLHLNLTQDVAAERSGISASTVKNIERGRDASIWALASLCRTYGHWLWITELAPEEQIDHRIAQMNGTMRRRASRRTKTGRAAGHV